MRGAGPQGVSIRSLQLVVLNRYSSTTLPSSNCLCLLLHWSPRLPIVMPVIEPGSASISDAPISPDVYNLPPNMQPQPALTHFWCWPCIKGLTTVSAKYRPNGTLESFVEVMMGDSYCSRRGSLGVCDECRSHHTSDCLEVGPVALRIVFANGSTASSGVPSRGECPGLPHYPGHP